MSDSEQRPGRLERGRLLLTCWSRELAVHAQQIASDSDRWFVSIVGGIDRGAQRAQSGFGKLLLSLPGMSTGESARQRIQRLIFAEAKKRGLEADDRALELFSERIGLMVELVLTGALKIEDIAFEQGVNETPPEDGPPPPEQ
jgi:hypothetical protein